ncbi:hypothetical protein V6N12_006152 [Hibiscus sabdariffa]|uniref:RNase H type-1 domain-containing protein n=1 Tax=Hibiscus sabdariffa TaxID=183260 RepID=A0ABR2EXA9_9ROSI
MVFDEDFSDRGVFEKGNRLSAESERTFGLGEPLQAAIPRCRLSWTGPARGWVKLNVDAAVCSVDGRAAIGGAFRDDMGIFEWMHKDWEVVVSHASRERNGVADSLAAMGWDLGMQGAVFLAPPEMLADRVEEERRSWVAL